MPALNRRMTGPDRVSDALAIARQSGRRTPRKQGNKRKLFAQPEEIVTGQEKREEPANLFLAETRRTAHPAHLTRFGRFGPLRPRITSWPQANGKL